MRAAFDTIAADAWFRGGGHERDTMPLAVLERDRVLATIMPGHGQPPPPGGDQPGGEKPGGGAAPPASEPEKPEGDPS